MKNKIKQGEYIRTKTGYIDKVIHVRDADEERAKYPHHPSKSYWRDHYDLEKVRYSITSINIVEHSKKLMDLIEVGDYVNGREVEETQDGTLGIVMADEFCPLNTIKIKNVVTKEQFEKIKMVIKDD